MVRYLEDLEEQNDVEPEGYGQVGSECLSEEIEEVELAGEDDDDDEGEYEEERVSTPIAVSTEIFSFVDARGRLLTWARLSPSQSISTDRLKPERRHSRLRRPVDRFGVHRTRRRL